MPPQRSAILDMTRGLAILMVVAFHYFPSKITNIGWTGVNLFFVLSGYLIGGLLIDNRKSDTYYATFYARRVARIAFHFMRSTFCSLPSSRASTSRSGIMRSSCRILHGLRTARGPSAG